MYMAGIMIEEEQMFNTHDVVSRLTNTQLDKALEVICCRLEKDSSKFKNNKVTGHGLYGVPLICVNHNLFLVPW